MQHKEVSRVVSAAILIGLVSIAVGQIGTAQGQSVLQPPPNGPGAVPRVVLGPGDINHGASRVYIFVDKTGFGHQHAVAGRLREGGLRVGGRSAGRMIFDMQSLRADTVEARRYIGLKGDVDPKTQQDVTANMQGADILDVGRFPIATFDVDSFHPVETRGKPGKVKYRLEGEFKLHGAKRPLRFDVDGTDERGYLHLKGTFRLRQTDYKIQPFKKALGTVGVADVLTIYGDIWVKR